MTAHRLPGARRLAIVLCTLLAAGCSALPGWPKKPEGPKLQTIAILPLTRDVNPGATEKMTGERPVLPEEAAQVVTAQLYGVLSQRSRWAVVPDLTTGDALPAISAGEAPEARARALAKATGADGVFFGSVSRFVERQGTEYGSRRPASVSFRLSLLLAESGKVIWSESFDETQQALSSNLLNWWMFWRQGPRWFSAAELARLGCEKLVDDLQSRLD